MTQAAISTVDAPAISMRGKLSILSGDWIAENLPMPNDPAAGPVDTSGIVRMDAFGASEILRIFGRPALERESTVSDEHRRLLDVVSVDRSSEPISNSRPPFASLGRHVLHAGSEATDLFGILGRIVASTAGAVLSGRGVRPAAFANQFYETVLRAIPIVCLISLVVGIILTQQSILQLRNFGATVFVVDLAGILMLREVGVLLAAIMVAGRSGSAVAAEIGAMRMREEMDALEVMGVDAYRAVVLPRAWSLVLGMPALAILGAMAGILGAAMVGRFAGDISFAVFASRLTSVVDVHTILVGMAKAPVMALAIVVIAVREGFQVSGSTDSLGRHTTASVVKSIFAVILLDGLFAIYFAAVGF